jgi:hypothetical protein
MSGFRASGVTCLKNPSRSFISNQTGAITHPMKVHPRSRLSAKIAPAFRFPRAMNDGTK